MKKRLEEILNLFAYGVNDLSHLVVCIIIETINVRTNDSGRIIPFVASVPFWLLAANRSMLWRTLR